MPSEAVVDGCFGAGRRCRRGCGEWVAGGGGGAGSVDPRGGWFILGGVLVEVRSANGLNEAVLPLVVESSAVRLPG